MSSESLPETHPPKNLPAEIFLDTTIFCNAVKSEKLKEKINETLSKFSWRGTSRHVELEYGNIILGTASYLLRMLKEMSFDDLLYHISEETDSVQLKRFAKIIEEASRDPKALRNEKVCLHFGDAIIAVHSNSYKCFFTQNINESRVLCKVLRQLLCYLKSALEEPPEWHEFREQ